MAPAYRYKIDPAALVALVQGIDLSHRIGGSITEVGVAQGDTSTFLLEHMRTTQDDRELLLFDTFSGFTDRSITHEVQPRGKSKVAYHAFKYGSESQFKKNLRRADYSNFKTILGRGHQFFAWAKAAPISVALLDVDLFTSQLSRFSMACGPTCRLGE